MDKKISKNDPTMWVGMIPWAFPTESALTFSSSAKNIQKTPKYAIKMKRDHS